MKPITIQDIKAYIFRNTNLNVSEEELKNLEKPFIFLENFAQGKIIYGINTGFGPMVQYKIESDQLNNLQYNLIRSHATGMGVPLEPIYAKSVLIARLYNFLQGNSGISIGVIKQLIFFINNNIAPEIPEHGGVGASGDLVQLAHLGLNLIGEGSIFVNGQLTDCATYLNSLNQPPLALKLRDGLGIINGTSCMTGIASINIIYAERLLDLAIAASCIINEVTDGFNDSFSEELNATKKHFGQNLIAKEMRTYLCDSDLLRKRTELYKDTEEYQSKQFKKKIQGYYSLRCVPQILGPIADTIINAKEVVENELNSTSDNPIIDTDEENVFHGGNFHGDYISLEMDKLKLAITKLTMLVERQLNYILNPRLNRKFPPFLNAAIEGLNFGYQGMQFTATSTTAENQALSTSLYIHSIPNSNDNQDIVSMGTNSALSTKKVIDNAYQVISIHLMALCQAIDLNGIENFAKLSSKSKKLHKQVRTVVPMIKEDFAPAKTMHEMYTFIKENDIV